MTITWYGHSCFKVQGADGSVVFDPYKPSYVPGLALPPLEAELCICSHGHDDHNFAEAVKITGKPAPGHFQIPAFHDDKRGALRGNNTVTLVETEGLRIVHLGDLGVPLTAEQLKKLGRADVLFLPVGGHYTIDAKTAKTVKDALSPAVTVPMHYRGEGFGFPVIAEVTEFERLCEDVVRIDSSSFEFESLQKPCTVILTCPTV